MTTTKPEKILLVSGEDITVLTPAEGRWLVKSRDTYMAQTKFTETTDLRDLDRLLFMELMVFRLSQYLGAGTDYDGFEIDDVLMRRNVREYSEQITRVKSSMGLTKAARDEAANDGDISSYLANLKMRAKIFGVHREKQLTKALVLFEEMASVISAFDRSDDEEKSRLGFSDEKEIVDWIRERAIPEYREIDAHFRANEQRYWIRSM